MGVRLEDSEQVDVEPAGEEGDAAPVSPAIGPDAVDAEAHLLAFLRDRAVACPTCGYDLRDLPRAECPECGQPLVLAVAAPPQRIGLLVAALAPSIFSLIAAGLLAVPIALSFLGLLGAGRPPLDILLLDAFGWASGLAGIALLRWRHRFLAWSRRRQVGLVFATWLGHVIAFAIVLAWLN